MTETLYAPTSPARLYALLLRLRPLQQGTLMPFAGELVHGAFISWLRAAAPDVANWYHGPALAAAAICKNLNYHPMMLDCLRELLRGEPGLTLTKLAEQLRARGALDLASQCIKLVFGFIAFYGRDLDFEQKFIYDLTEERLPRGSYLERWNRRPL
jgi:hypothetical protein